MATTRQQKRAAERDKAKRLQGGQGKGTSPMVWAISACLLVLLAVAVLVTIKATQGGSSSTPATSTGGGGGNSSGATPADPAVVKSLASVPAAAFDKVGYQLPSDLLPKPISGSPLTLSGKPGVIYVGAEFCPYCAAQRWAMVAALSRFGTFSNLGATHSSSTDVDPNTPTFSFHGSSYSSPYLTFSPAELYTNVPQGNSYTALDTPTAAQQTAWNTYNSSNSFPFIDFGNRYLSNWATYNPGILGGKTMSQVAAAVNDPTSDIGKAVLSTANGYTAAICKLTGAKPADVCSSPGVQAAAKQMSK